METKYKNIKLLPWSIKNVLISRLRNKNTTHQTFVRTTHRLSTLLWEFVLSAESPIYTKDEKEGPISKYTHYDLPDNKFALISILRTADSMIHVGPLVEENNFMVGKVLVQRDEKSKDKKPIFLYKKIPKDVVNRIVYICDNMIATGGSLLLVIEKVLEMGVDIKNIRVVNILCVYEGLDKILEKYPDLIFFTTQIDEKLSENKYIIPGLGDFGDRYYNSPNC